MKITTKQLRHLIKEEIENYKSAYVERNKQKIGDEMQFSANSLRKLKIKPNTKSGTIFKYNNGIWKTLETSVDDGPTWAKRIK